MDQQIIPVNKEIYIPSFNEEVDEYYDKSPYPCSFTLKVSVDGNSAVASCTDDRGYKSLLLYSRIWPTDLIVHNAKFKTKKDVVKE